MRTSAQREVDDASASRLALHPPTGGFALQLLSQWPSDTAVLNAELRIVWLSPSFAKRLGVDAHACAGSHWFDIHAAAGSLASEYARGLSGDTVELPYIACTDADNTRYRSVSLRPWQPVDDPQSGGAALLVMEADVTETITAAVAEHPDLQAQFEQRRLAFIAAIARSSRDSVCALDQAGRILFASESFAELVGMPAEQMLGADALSFVHSDDLTEVRDRVRSGAMLDNPQRMRRVRFRIRATRTGSEWRWIECLAVNALADPSMRALLLYSNDVTQEIALEEQLRRRERRFIALTEKSDDLIVVLDVNGRATFESSSVARVLGYRSSELDVATIVRRVHPQHRRRVLTLGRRLMAEHGSEGRIEFMIREASGSHRWLEAVAVDLIDDPDIAGMLINARDVTQRKLAELERDAALDGASVFVWEQNLATNQVRWLSRHSGLAMLGALGEDHNDDAWNAAIHPEDLDRVMAAYDRIRSGHISQLDLNFRLRGPGGDWLHFVERSHIAAARASVGGAMLRGVTIDVTGPRRIEHALAQSRERFQLALECANIGFYEWDLPSDAALGLEAWCASLGLPLTPTGCHSEIWAGLMHPDDVPVWQQARRDHIAGDTDFAECHYRLRAGTSRWLWVFDRSQIVERDSSGNVVRLAGICMDVDRTRRTELALGDAETRLSTTVWAAQLGLWELDTSTQRARWYSNWCELEDLEPCEGPDHVALWDSRIHPRDVDAAAARFSDMLENRCDVYDSEYRVRTRSGDWLWIQERCRAVLRDAEGRPLRIVGTCMNIHARKEAEQALIESQLRLQSIAMNSSDWLILLGTDLRVITANRSFQGTSPDRLVGIDAAELLPPNQRAEMRRFFGRVLAAEGVCEMAQIAATDQDDFRHFLIRAQAVRSGDTPVAIAVTATEITALRRQQQMLELQGRILDTMREGVVLVNTDNVIRLTNPAFERLFAAEAGSLVGQSVEPLFHSDVASRRAVESQVMRQLASRSAVPFEFECTRRDGTTFFAACVVTPITIDDRDHWLAVLNDISERKVLEREILEVSNREQHRIGNDLHDGLGQELTGVAMMLRGLTARIRRDFPSMVPDVDDIVALVNRSIYNTRTLAHGLSPVSLERGGLIPALRTLAARSRETYGLSISLRTRLQIPLRIDESAANHLFRIVQEALSNAMRHGRATRVTMQMSVDENAVRLSVHDDGRGLPAEGPSDSGLGLRTMRYRAHVIGGELTVTNHRHGGTIVRCSCPHLVREPQALELSHQKAHRRAHTRRGDPY